MSELSLLQRLREAGRTGLDLSPGDSLCAEAAREIERLTPKDEPAEERGEPVGHVRSVELVDLESNTTILMWGHQMEGAEGYVALYTHPSEGEGAREALRLLGFAERKRVENRVYGIAGTDLDGPTYVWVLSEGEYKDLRIALTPQVPTQEKS